MPTPEPIILLEPSQALEAARIITQAFKDDPAGVFITPEPSKRADLLSWFANAGLKLGCTFGEIFTTPDLTGVAVWFRPGHADHSLWSLIQAGILPPFKIGPAALYRFLKVMASFSQAHRRLVPENHWYLFILTVLPALQGQGLGSRLIRPILDRADAETLPCYLETANPRSVPFYKKHGFKAVHQALLPGSSTPIWGLRREPLSKSTPGS